MIFEAPRSVLPSPLLDGSRRQVVEVDCFAALA